MAMKKCEECKGQVSTKAKQCPNCGAPVKANVSASGMLKALGFLLLLAIIIPFFIPNNSDSSRNNSQSNVPAASKPSAKSSSTTISEASSPAVKLVAGSIAKNNKLGISASQLRTKPNPKGKGTFVYVPKTDYFGVKRYHVWLALYAQAFALNGPSKNATPTLPWPREAPDEVWSKSNLSKASASEAIKVVFGR